MKTKVITGIYVLLGFMAFGQWSTNPAVNNAIYNLSGDQTLPKIGICSDGSIYIACFSNQTGFYNVRLQRLDSQGNELWAHNGLLVFNDSTDSWVSDWDMAVDAADHAILTFSEVENGNWNITAFRISPAGAFAWGNNGIALSNNANFNAAPKVTCTPAGNSIIAWSSGDYITMQKLNSAGLKQWGENGINVTTANQTSWPQLLSVGNDDFIMKYFDDAGSFPYPTRHVYAQRFNSTGTGVWASPALISDAGGIAGFNQIFSFINDGNDGFFIAWHDDRDNNLLSSSFVQHVSSSGQVLFPNDGVEVTTLGGNHHFYPYIACPDGSSDVYVFWNEMNSNQTTNGIYGQKISASGNRVWGNNGIAFIPLSSSTITPWAADKTGEQDVVLFFSEGNSASQDLKAMRISTTGTFVWPGQFVTISSATSSKSQLEMSKFANGQWIVAWADNRTDINDVYAQNFSIEGTIGPYEPTFGNIQGHITLTGGNGNVTQVVVNAGPNSTLPDPLGNYILNVPTGTYNVTASLNSYYPDTVFNVVVLEDQSTNNVDLELISIPTTGFIEGVVDILNGNGNVTETIVSAGTVTTSPDATGYYSMEVGVGLWDVTATLEGYTPQTRSNVSVQPGEITEDIDFQLSLLPVTGFLYGTVEIEGNMASVTVATVNSGTIQVTPDDDGEYLMELPIGENTVIASHPHTLSDTAIVSIEAGGSTNQDFLLMMLRRDMIVTAHDDLGNILNNVSVEITGPEGVYSGEITNDSLVFQQVPFGFYHGEGLLWGIYSGLADTVIDYDNCYVNFVYVISNTDLQKTGKLQIYPNPVSITGNLVINANADGILHIYDSHGRKVSENYLECKNLHIFPVTLLFNYQSISEGIYLLHFTTANDVFMGKIMIVN